MERSIFPILTQRAKGPGIVLLGPFGVYALGLGTDVPGIGRTWN